MKIFLSRLLLNTSIDTAADRTLVMMYTYHHWKRTAAADNTNNTLLLIIAN